MNTTPNNEPVASEPHQPEQQPEVDRVSAPALVSSLQSGDVRIRRAPKYGPFLIIGGGIGAIATFVLTMAYPVDPAVGFGVLFGYFSLFGIPVGVAVGALVALALDRVSIRRSCAATVEHETVEPESHEGTLE